MGCCDKFCLSVTAFWLHLFNLADALLGLVLLAFSGFIFTAVKGHSASESRSLACVQISSLVLGLVLTISALLSCWVICSPRLGWLVFPCCVLALVNAILSCAFAALMLGLRAAVFSVVDTVNLTSGERNAVHQWYIFTASMLFVVSLCELFRFKLLDDFHSARSRMQDSEEKLLLAEEQYWDDRNATVRSEVGSKYDGLRAFYKAKYKGRDAADADPNECTL